MSSWILRSVNSTGAPEDEEPILADRDTSLNHRLPKFTVTRLKTNHLSIHNNTLIHSNSVLVPVSVPVGNDDSHFNVLLIVRGQVTPFLFFKERRAEAESIRGLFDS